MSIRQAEKVPSRALGVSIPSWSCHAAHACIFAQKRAAQNQAAQHFLSLAPGSGQLMAVWDERLRQAESKKHFLLWGSQREEEATQHQNPSLLIFFHALVHFPLSLIGFV